MKKLQLRINGKMLVFILGTTALVSIFSIGFIAIHLKNTSEKNSIKILDGLSVDLFQQTKQVINHPSNSAHVLADFFTETEAIPQSGQIDVFTQMLDNVLLKNPDFYAVWVIYEPTNTSFSALPSEGKTIFEYFAVKETEEVHHQYTKPESITALYSQVKSNLAELVSEPRLLSKQNREGGDMLIVDVVVPIIEEFQFLGAIGIQLNMNNFQKQFASFRSRYGHSVYLISPKGQIISFSDSTHWGTTFTKFAPKIDKKYPLSDLNQQLQSKLFEAKEPISGLNSLFKFEPLKIGKSNTSWVVGLSIPLSDLYFSGHRTFLFALFIGIVTILIITILILGVAASITKPLSKVTEQLSLISKGEINNIEKPQNAVSDEISDIARGISDVSTGLLSATKFAQEIGKGKLDASYTLLSENDLLGNSLLSMQESLKNAKIEEEKKRIEDEKRNWVTHGLATFGEIIRQHNDNMEEFTMNVIKELLNYIDAAQGAMYINQQLENDYNLHDAYELKAAIAYSKPVMIQKTIIKGQELVGRVIEENRSLLLEHLPERYVLLSPGMHNAARPQNLLIVPISVNNNCLGVFELLSYKVFEPYHLEFIEKLSENIASIISSVKTNLRTAKLLQQSQYQADEMAQHEEEMRQNLEEMQATQEESAKREENLSIYIKAIKNRMMIAELDMDGRILDMSPSMSTAYAANLENLRGKFFDAVVTSDNDSKNEYTEFWAQMIHQGSGRRKQVIVNRGKELTLFESYLVMPRDRMAPIVLVFVTDHSKEKELNDQLTALIKSQS